jgi:hypothetical protein
MAAGFGSERAMDDVVVVLAEIKVQLRQLLEHVTDQEQRIRWLERTVWLAIGIAGVAGGGIGAIAGAVVQGGKP